MQEEAQTLDLLNKVGIAVAAELDLERAVQVVTDAATELSGAAFGSFFYNVIDEKGETYTLYTLAGVPREAFANFPMPRNTAVFGPTFRGEGIVRSDDITKDPRYGKNAPHRGMPNGHLPLRSYLAAPVKSRSGEVLGGLFFGHPEVGIFSERAERIVAAIAVQAGIAIDKARLYRAAQDEIERRKRVEAQLRDSEQTLEARVVERTLDLRKAQDQLVQSQKMEAIGQLTGGMAHDFNNLLTIVMGNLESIQRNLAADAPARLRRWAENSMHGAKRAATLTQHLLAFSRRQPLDPKPTEVNKLIATTSEVLGRTLGERVEVQTVLGAGVWNVEVDPNQLETALLNLAVNARDAMPDGGKLTIETTNTHLDDAYVAQTVEVLAGQYVAICVSDTGSGMSKETLDHAFEPFFTTKPTGQGTGLGLSQVYGFVKQSGGHVKIYSEEGQGTTVKLYLPRLVGKGVEAADEGQARTIPDGNHKETVLLVEDDPGVREYSAEILRDLGYTVIEAKDGPAALRQIERNETIDLLFTDIGLPGMNGRELADEAVRRRPKLKVLYTSAYARNAIVHHGRLDPGVHLIT
jgi:signal transduction histidine kinase